MRCQLGTHLYHICNFSNDGINQLNMNNFHQMIFTSRLKLELALEKKNDGENERI